MPSQDEAHAASATNEESLTEVQSEREETAALAGADSATPGAPEAVWADLATAGLSFLERLGQALQSPRPQAPLDSSTMSTSSISSTKPSAGAGLLPESLLARDERTGQPCLKLPLPKPEVLKTIADLLGRLAGMGK